MKLVIGNKNYSSWSLRAWFLLAYHEITFEEIRVSLSVAGTTAEIAKYSKAGKVPVLWDGDLLVWDSLAICEYVSERYLAGGGWPEDLKMRAEARSCSAEMHSGFDQLRRRMPMNCRAANRQIDIARDLQQEISRIDDLWTSLRKRFTDSGPWLFGDFTIADCMFAPVVFRFNTYTPTVSSLSAEYMYTLLHHPKMQLWQQEAQEEEEIIEDEEVG